ncbi:MAG: DNA mismatch endonuclease Vsr [Pirellulaceae bacterium]|nr:DNA mismatch endonuclease Vsr [Pirellulaceae bacterium]
MDTLTKLERSRVMSLVRSKDTRPEMRVRTLVHALGYRYRLHVRGLPGRPDMVFPRRRCIILVHGCFWHQHKCKAGNRQPKSRVEFWRGKLAANVRRDEKQKRVLRGLGWRVMIIWECETLTKSRQRLTRRIIRFLGER